jgi:hypothetical protein
LPGNQRNGTPVLLEYKITAYTVPDKPNTKAHKNKEVWFERFEHLLDVPICSSRQVNKLKIT